MLRHLIHFILLVTFNSGMYSQDNPYVLKDFVIEGNKKTKDWLIIRESGFRSGDLVDKKTLAETMEAIRRNITNLQLFIHVSVQAVVLPGDDVLVLVQVVERWYLYPIPYVRLAEPNFNTWLRNSKQSRTNYGVKLKQFNFRGRDERLELTFQAGYARELGVNYINPYLISNKDWGLQFSAQYKEFEEINIGTVDNERIFYEGNADTRAEQRYLIGTSFRPDILTENIFNLSYQNIRVSQGVQNASGIQLEQDAQRMRFFTLAYSFDFVDVNDRNYPTDGKHFSFNAEQYGLGIMHDSPNVFRSAITLRMYRPISKKLTLQHMLKGQASLFEDSPYFLQDGLGYGNNAVRSYEYYVMDSQFYLLSRNNFQFNLLPHQLLNMNDIGSVPLSKVDYSFYLNLIADLGYAGDRLYAEQNPLNNTWLLGTGIGLDFVTNYGMVIRSEFTVNRLGEAGFYLHYRKSI